MIHWRTYCNGKLWGIAYLFEHAGDALPRHRHDEEDRHNVIILAGSIEVEGTRAATGDIIDELPEWHSIVALEPNTRLLNLYINGLPVGATGEPASGTF